MDKKRVFLLFFIILLVSVIWELLQSPLFVYTTTHPAYLRLLLSAITDAIIIECIFIIIYIKNYKRASWIENPSKYDFAAIIILGVVVSMLIEATNIRIGKWVYTELMPTIFGAGIVPLIQLFSTAIISLFLMNLIVRD